MVLSSEEVGTVQVRGAAVRQAILQAAHELLSTPEAGIPGLDAIAQRSRVTRATVYNHFHSRAALIDALLSSLVIEHGMDQLLTQTRALPPAEALDAAVATCASFWRAQQHVLRRLLAADPNEREVLSDIRRREEWRYNQFAELVERLRPERAEADVVAAVISMTAFATWDQLATRIADDTTVVQALQMAAASAIRLEIHGPHLQDWLDRAG